MTIKFDQVFNRKLIGWNLAFKDMCSCAYASLSTVAYALSYKLLKLKYGISDFIKSDILVFYFITYFKISTLFAEVQ